MASPNAVSIVRELGIRESGQSGSLALLGSGDHAAPYPSGRAKIGHHKANRLAYFSSPCRIPDYAELNVRNTREARWVCIAPFRSSASCGIVRYALQGFEKAQQLVAGSITSFLAFDGRNFRQDLLFQSQVCIEVYLGCLDRLVSKPECNHGTIHSSL